MCRACCSRPCSQFRRGQQQLPGCRRLPSSPGQAVHPAAALPLAPVDPAGAAAAPILAHDAAPAAGLLAGPRCTTRRGQVSPAAPICGLNIPDLAGLQPLEGYLEYTDPMSGLVCQIGALCERTGCAMHMHGCCVSAHMEQPFQLFRFDVATLRQSSAEELSYTIWWLCSRKHGQPQRWGAGSNSSSQQIT